MAAVAERIVDRHLLKLLRAPPLRNITVLACRALEWRIVHLRGGGGGFDFLGFHHRYVPHGARRLPPATASSFAYTYLPNKREGRPVRGMACYRG